MPLPAAAAAAPAAIAAAVAVALIAAPQFCVSCAFEQLSASATPVVAKKPESAMHATMISRLIVEPPLLVAFAARLAR
jgi:hypothetical protein